MKYCLLFLFALGFSSAANAFEFTIKGTFASAPAGNMIYIHINGMMVQGTEVHPVKIEQNKFIYSGNIDEPKQCIVSWKKVLPQDKSEYLSFILDKGVTGVSVSSALNTAKVAGSKANNDLLLFLNLQKQLQPAFQKFNTDAEEASQKSRNIDSLRAVFMPRLEKLKAAAVMQEAGFIKSHPDAFISMLVIPEIVQESKNYFLADSLFGLLNSEIKNTPSGKAIYARISSEKKLSVGATAPDFEQADKNGKTIRLSSLRGKYVLIDFWASWCGPCRQENPNVVENYKLFKDRGFTVLGISLDFDRSKWLNAVEQDGLEWSQVSDLKYWDNAVAKLYGIQEIPRNFLINDKGVIIARDLRGPELKRILNKSLIKAE